MLTACQNPTEDPYPIAEPFQAFPAGTADETAMLNFDLNMPLDLDMSFDTGHFGFFMDSPQPGTPAPKQHPIPAPIITEASAINISESASLITPPGSLSSAIEISTLLSHSWTPTLLQVVAKLYATPHSTAQRFDSTLKLARECLDFVSSYLPDLASPLSFASTSTFSPLACVVIVQQVLADYSLLKIEIDSRLLSTNSKSSNSNSIPESSGLLTRSLKEASREDIYVGSFQVESLECQYQVMKAIVSMEIESLKGVLTRLEEWTEELSKNGREEGKLANLVLVTLKSRLTGFSQWQY